MGKSESKRNWKRIFVRALLVTLLLVVTIAGVLTLVVRTKLLASLPTLEGEIQLQGLSAPVEVERDANGVPRIHGRNRLDVARALGFLHGQERFFQMDLLRRAGAGELAELLGPAVVGADRNMRIHRFRDVAQRSLEAPDFPERGLLTHYTEGVNAGLAALGAKPPEYYAMRADPAPWLVEDCLLVMSAMYDNLQGDNGRRESYTGLAHDLLPGPLFAFLSAQGNSWDAALVGDALVVPGIPGPEIFDIRGPGPQTRITPSRVRFDESSLNIVGSNNWAVAGTHTANGSALVANDMHLGLSLPNTWYRAALSWDDGPTGVPLSVAGVLLPGIPGIVVGSNGRVAWSFTNSQGDWKDLVIVEVDPDNSHQYRTPDGWQPFEVDEQTIHVRGGADVTLEVRSTIWGPIIDHDYLDRPRALRWIAHDPLKRGLGFLAVEQSREIEEAMRAANNAGIPTQNFTVGDSTGRIGWTLMGPMPQRFGFDGRVPTSWADGTRGWDGHLLPAEYPRILDPESGRIWTANNRIVDGEMLSRIGEGGYAGGARAGQIRDGLLALEQATPADMLAIQLDDRALFLERWRDLLMQVLTDDAVGDDSARQEFARFVREDWSGHASVDSVGYRLVRGYRTFLAERVFAPLVQDCTTADDRFDTRWIGRWEGPLWKLVQEQPQHLLDPNYESWDEFLLSVVDVTTDYFLASEGATLAGATWGARNTVRVRHPISYAVPQLSDWLDAPATASPGDSQMPRVQSPSFGASERLAVSVGYEADGLFHMPGGQSGHPFAETYLAGHEDWVEGRATPFLPGETRWRLTLVP